MLRLTLLTSAVASAAFVGTLAFAPAVINIGERLSFGQAEIARAGSAATAAPGDRQCRSALHRIVAALRSEQCS